MLSKSQALVAGVAILSSAVPSLAYTNTPSYLGPVGHGPDNHDLEVQHFPAEHMPYAGQHEFEPHGMAMYHEHEQMHYSAMPHEPMQFHEHEFEQWHLGNRDTDEIDLDGMMSLSRRDVEDIIAASQLNDLVKRGKKGGSHKHLAKKNKKLRHKEKHLKHKDHHLKHEVKKLKHEGSEASEKREAEPKADFDGDFEELVKRTPAGKGGHKKKSNKQLRHKEKHLKHKDHHLEHKVHKLKEEEKREAEAEPEAEFDDEFDELVKREPEPKGKGGKGGSKKHRAKEHKHLKQKDHHLKHKEKHLKHEVHKLKEEKREAEPEADPEAWFDEESEELVKREPEPKGKGGKGGSKKHRAKEHKHLKQKDHHLKHKEKHLKHEVHKLKGEKRDAEADPEAEFIIEAILEARDLEERDAEPEARDLEERDAEPEAEAEADAEAEAEAGSPAGSKQPKSCGACSGKRDLEDRDAEPEAEAEADADAEAEAMWGTIGVPDFKKMMHHGGHGGHGEHGHGHGHEGGKHGHGGGKKGGFRSMFGM